MRRESNRLAPEHPKGSHLILLFHSRAEKFPRQ
jgi:hypothetical protein